MASFDHLPATFRTLMREFKKLPGVGPKTALRYIFAIARLTPADRASFVHALTLAAKTARRCNICQAISDSDPCAICANPKRDRKTICVVAHDEDLLTLEEARAYAGTYHVLGSSLNPLEGTPEDHRQTALLHERVIRDRPIEIILAFNPDIEGEATMMYLARLLAPTGVRITRLARGLPMGSVIEYADPITVADALSGRREVSSSVAVKTK